MTTVNLVKPEDAPVVEVPEKPVDTILEALMARMAPVGSANPYRKVMCYGPPGVGKSVFAGTAPKNLFVDVEKGSMSLNNHKELADVTVLEFKSVRQLELLIEKLAAGAFGDRFETIVIDSFSELQKRDLDDIVRKAASEDASRNKFLPIGPDYNINTEHLRVIASALRDLPMHVIVTAHAKEEKDDATGRVLVRPNLTPKLAGTMAGIFDVVGYMTVNGSGESATRTLQVHPTASVVAKSRVGGIPAIIENPTFDKLFATAN